MILRGKIQSQGGKTSLIEELKSPVSHLTAYRAPHSQTLQAEAAWYNEKEASQSLFPFPLSKSSKLILKYRTTSKPKEGIHDSANLDKSNLFTFLRYIRSPSRERRSWHILRWSAHSRHVHLQVSSTTSVSFCFELLRVLHISPISPLCPPPPSAHPTPDLHRTIVHVWATLICI